MAYTLLVVLIVLVAILMIFIVLIQESKGGGLASNFSSTNSIMGVRKTTDIVEKLTWGLAAALVVISVACAYVAPQAAGESSVLEGATQEQTALPAMPGASKDAAAGAQKAIPAAGLSALMPRHWTMAPLRRPPSLTTIPLTLTAAPGPETSPGFTAV